MPPRSMTGVREGAADPLKWDSNREGICDEPRSSGQTHGSLLADLVSGPQGALPPPFLGGSFLRQSAQRKPCPFAPPPHARVACRDTQQPGHFRFRLGLGRGAASPSSFCSVRYARVSAA